MKSDHQCRTAREEIAALVLGELDPAAAERLDRHIQDCVSCRSFREAMAGQEDELRSTFDVIARGVERVEQFVERFYEPSEKSTTPASSRSRRLIGGFRAMRHSKKILAAAAAIAITFTGLASWLIPGQAAPSLAFGHVMEQLRVFRPYSCTYTFEYEGEPPFSYRLMRLNLSQRREVRADGTILVFDMSSQPVRILRLHPDQKTAVEEVLVNEGSRQDPDILSIVAGMSDGAAEDLGVQEIDGRPAHGFHRPDPVNEFTIWADPETGLPIRIEVVQPRAARTLILSEFDFDTPLDASLFATTAPPGYTVTKDENTSRSTGKQRRIFRPYSCTYTFQDEGKPPSTYREMRLSLERRRELRADGTIYVFDMSSRPLRILKLDPDKQTAVEEVLENQGPRSDPDMLAGMFDGSAEDLGLQEIAGRPARVFRQPDPVNEFTYWADPDTGLPIRVEVVQPQIGRKITLSDFDFDSPLDESLFAATAPAGYSVIRDGK